MWQFTKKGKPSRYVFRVPTVDDWSPNIPGDLVEVSVIPLVTNREERDRFPPKLDEPWLIRVCVWGNDDVGMEIDRENWTMREAIDWANQIPLPIRRSELSDLGFEYC